MFIAISIGAFIKVILEMSIFVSNGNNKEHKILFMPPFDEERAYCFVHVGRSVPFHFGLITLACLPQTLSPGSNVPKPFPISKSRTLDLPSSNFVYTSFLGSRGTLLILWQNLWSNNFKNDFFLHTFVQLILNWLIHLYKTSVTKKQFRGFNVLQTSLVIPVTANRVCLDNVLNIL